MKILKNLVFLSMISFLVAGCCATEKARIVTQDTEIADLKAQLVHHQPKPIGIGFGILSNIHGSPKVPNAGFIELLGSVKERSGQLAIFARVDIIDAELFDTVQFVAFEKNGVLCAKEIKLSDTKSFKSLYDASDKIIDKHSAFAHDFAPQHRLGHIYNKGSRSTRVKLRNKWYIEADFQENGVSTADQIYIPETYIPHHILHPTVLEERVDYYYQFYRKQGEADEFSRNGRKFVSEVLTSHPDNH